MPNEEIIAKIEELKKICDPNEKEANLILEHKKINEKIINIQRELSELRNISDTLYYDEIQAARDTTRKAELQRQVIGLEKKVSVLEKELKELQEKEAKKFEELKALQQKKNENTARASVMKNYNDILESTSAKENTENILKEVEKKVEEDSTIFEEKAKEYKKLQGDIEEKANLINETKKNIENLQNQLDQLSKDLSNGDKYINQTKKQEDKDKIVKLEENLQSLQNRQKEIVGDIIMLLSRAHEAAINGDMVSILNKMKSVKELLLGKPSMEVPENSIEEQTAKAIEDRDTYFNEINGKSYGMNGLEVAEERIEDLNASIAKWTEEENNLKTGKEEIDSGLKYGCARKIAEINEKIATQEKEVEEFESKESLTNDEIVAIDKRKKEIAAQKEILNRYFADQTANIKEAECLEATIKLIEERRTAAVEEIKELKKISKSLAGIDLLSKIKDNNELQNYVNKVMDLKKLPEYRRMLVFVDEILDSLGKDIIVPPIEEKEEEIKTDTDVKSISTQEENIEIIPIEEVKEDILTITPPLKEETEEIKLGDSKTQQEIPIQNNTGVVFEQAFKEPSINNDELTKEIDKVLSATPSDIVSSQEKKEENSTAEIVNPFANISDLKTVEDTSVQESITKPLKVENQEAIVSLDSFKQPEQVSNVPPQMATQKVVEMAPIESQTIKRESNNLFTSVESPTDLMIQEEPQERQDNSINAIESSTNSIDDFFNDMWNEASTDNQILGKVA